MAKQSGLGDQLFVSGYDLSGDVGAVQTLKSSSGLLNVTGLDKSALERLYGVRDGEISFNCFYNPSSGHSHPVLKTLPTSDIELAYFHGSAIGNPAACQLSKQIDYGWARSQDGALMGSVQALATGGGGLEHCEQLTAGKRTDTGATNGADLVGPAQAAAVNITSVDVANPGTVNATAHGLISGDSVVIAGTTTTPSINGRYAVTRISADQFSIPVNVTSGQVGAAGTVTKTSTNYGLAAYLHVFSVTGTSVTAKLQHSADSGVADAWADIAGGAFAAATSGASPQAQRIETSLTATIKADLRLVTTGTFNPATFAVAFVRYLGARDP